MPGDGGLCDESSIQLFENALQASGPILTVAGSIWEQSTRDHAHSVFLSSDHGKRKAISGAGQILDSS
jgi:hypothetical protein